MPQIRITRNISTMGPSMRDSFGTVQVDASYISRGSSLGHLMKACTTSLSSDSSMQPKIFQVCGLHNNKCRCGSSFRTTFMFMGDYFLKPVSFSCAGAGLRNPRGPHRLPMAQHRSKFFRPSQKASGLFVATVFRALSTVHNTENQAAINPTLRKQRVFLGIASFRSSS